MPETSEDGQDVRRARPPELENRASQNSLFPKGRCVAWGKTITELHIYGKRTGVLQNERSGRKHVTAALRSSTYGEQRARRPPEAACKKEGSSCKKIARRTRETSRTVAQTPENGCRRRSSRRQPPQGSRRIADTGDAGDQPPDRVKVRLRLRRDELGDAIGIHEVGKTRLLFEIDKRRVAP